MPFDHDSSSLCLPMKSLSFNPSLYLLASFLRHHKLATAEKKNPPSCALPEQTEGAVLFSDVTAVIIQVSRAPPFKCQGFALLWVLCTFNTCHKGTLSTR